MKVIAKHLAEAVKLERLAAVAKEQPELEAALKEQAAAYRNLATKRAKRLGLLPRNFREENNSK